MAATVRQLGNTSNTSQPANAPTPAAADQDYAPNVPVDAPAPVRNIDPVALANLCQKYKGLFDRYASERSIAEQKWLKNLRQYLGIYDPEVERALPPQRSRAYPRLTRMKCISMLSRLMNLMFPGNEKNWELNASPSPEMSPEMVAKAVQDMLTALQADGQQVPEITQDMIDEAVRELARTQAEQLSTVIDDQLLELGGGQTLDWIALNRKVCDSGIKYGIGVLEGPYVRKIQQSGWVLVAPGQPGAPPQFQPQTHDIYKPLYEHLPVWDFYPDMSARQLPGDGYFVRKILGRGALRKLADRPDFFAEQIKQVIAAVPGGNYTAKGWENELKTMGLSINADTTSVQSNGREKYEVIIWKGPISAQTLRDAGADVPDEFMADDVDAELWFTGNYVIKAEVNAWRKLGVTMSMAHVFNFDEDDTSPIGQGLPAIVRDSQLSVCATTRMTLDNASVTCGPNLEVNTALCRADQDLTGVAPYKLWYRDDDGPSSQFPAVRPIQIDAHLADLQSLVKMFLEFAELETFIGPSTGGDFQKMPSEPFRTAAGASALRGDAALPFKDIVRNYDTFTQSVIWSIVLFNKKFNPDLAPEGDYDVIPRGATSLIAKEVRGIQIDTLSQTLTPDERDHVDERKFVEAKFASRDLQGMLVSNDEAERRKTARAQLAQQQAEQQRLALEAETRKTNAEAFKSVTQGQKNSATADKTSVDAALSVVSSNDGSETANSGASKAAA